MSKEHMLTEFKHFIYNYLYQKSNIRLAGILFDVELEGDMVHFYITLPNVTSEGLFILTKMKLKNIVRELEENDDDLTVFAGKLYDIIMEQVMDAEQFEREEQGDE